MRQRELEIRLSQIPTHPDPVAGLEQYSTPSPVAADLLYRALARGDLQGRAVLDLGCGTGILAIGAALLGARSVVGVDVDEKAIRVARTSAERLGAEVEFRIARAEEVDDPFDTVVMNPPFGAQKPARGADLRFVEVALTRAPVAYSLHQSKTRDHVVRRAPHLDAAVTLETRYGLEIPKRFAFHRKERVIVDVDLLRWTRMG